MDADDGDAPVADDTHSAWTALDDALQILVRAESLVLLLENAFDLEEHHRYGAHAPASGQVAWRSRPGAKRA